MGRQNEVSLQYFELDCHMDDKIELIEAEYGLKGFAIVIKLYQRIYGGEYGYYCEFTPDIALLLAARLCGSSGGASGKVGTASGEGSLPGFPKNLITDVVAASIRRGIFSARLFKEYGILTSGGIQKQYLKATAKRQAVNLKKEYLLISVPKNRSNVAVNSISSGRKAIDGGINSQSKSRVRVKENKNTMCKADADALFERLWALYPLKKGKGSVSDAQKMRLLEIGYDEMARAIERYKKYVDSIDYLHYKNGSTFFNSGYIDYLDRNYEDASGGGKEGAAGHQGPGQCLGGWDGQEDGDELVGDDWMEYGPGWEGRGANV